MVKTIILLRNFQSRKVLEMDCGEYLYITVSKLTLIFHQLKLKFMAVKL